MRIDRDERHLQTEIVGLAWRPEYVDPKILGLAIERVPNARRDQAHRAYQVDVRDTATPRGMAALLERLAAGKLLSAASSRYLLGVMQETVTFPDRLKAGTAPGWTLGHKTGTGGTWNGVTVATNDVGVLGAPDGGTVAVAVFIGDSRAPSGDKAALMAKIAAAAIACYRSSN
jgi:beta-lactamase class A